MKLANNLNFKTSFFENDVETKLEKHQPSPTPTDGIEEPGLC